MKEITSSIKCEKCKTIIGKREKDNKDNVKSVFLSNAVICPHCKAEFCKDCYDEMVECYCCGAIFKK